MNPQKTKLSNKKFPTFHNDDDPKKIDFVMTERKIEDALR